MTRIVKVGSLVASALLAGSLAACSGLTTQGNEKAAAQSDAKKGLIAFLLPEQQTPRWEEQDAPLFKEAVTAIDPSLRVETYNANGDPAAQLKQAETALTNGATTLVVTAVDQFQAAQIVNLAHQQGAKVVSYDHFIRKADLDAYVAVDGETVGRLQGQWLADNTKDGDSLAVINGSTDDENAHLFNTGYMSVLKPLFESGKRKLAGEQWTQGWVPATAQKGMEQILTKTKDNVDGVLSANDGMAAAVIQALKARGLKVPITGLDGTLASDQLILRGDQSMTVWRSLKEQATLAAKIAAAYAKGQTPDKSLFTATKNNDQKDVPWAQVKARVIDAKNMNLLIDDGAVTKAALCKDIPASTGPC